MPESNVQDLTSTINIIGTPHNVILFNDETHGMDEVVGQIIKAIHCDEAKATAIMYEAHAKGRAIVFSGGVERCEHVACVLEEIRLGVSIEKA